ncbi:MAG: hypothetical protein IPK82_07570 [Polyangiaceae bacterium]|nr:hypothetical protein [Polyangiaceae bacterium]
MALSVFGCNPAETIGPETTTTSQGDETATTSQGDETATTSQSDETATTSQGDETTTSETGETATCSCTGDPSSCCQQSGSRIRLKYRHGADGTKAFMGLYDSDLQTDCVVWPAADLVDRCIPNFTASAGYYADASCTTPIAVVGCYVGAAPKYVSFLPEADPNNPCAPPGYRVFPLAAEFMGAQTYQGSPGACNETQVASFQKRYLLGPEIAPADLVSFDVKVE